MEPRQLDVITGYACGLSRRQVAVRLGISEATVARNVRLAARACRVPPCRAALVDFAYRRRLLAHLPPLRPWAPVCLDDRLLELLPLLARGLTAAQIGRELFLSEGGVKARVKRLLRAMDAVHRAHAVALAHELGLLEGRRRWVAVA